MLGRLIPVLLVLCGVLVLAASGAAVDSKPTSVSPEVEPEPEPEPEGIVEGRTVTPEEALLMDSREVARRYGISVDEARARMELQASGAIDAFADVVRRRERHRYGGLYIQQEPEYRVVVQLTSGGRLSDVHEYVPDRLQSIVVVRRVERTAAQLGWMHARVARLRSIVPFDSWTNVPLNRVEVQFIAATSSEVAETIRTLREAAAQSGEPLPDWVAVTGNVLPVAQTGGEHPDFLLTHSTVGSGFAFTALPSGVLQFDLDRGCVLLSGQAVIWPAGTTLTSDPPLLHLPGGLTARPGDTVRGGGGGVPRAGPRQSSNGIEGDLEKALACATEPEVVIFGPRAGAMSVTRR